MVTYEEYKKAIQTANEYLSQLETESQCAELTINAAASICTHKTKELVKTITKDKPMGIHKFFALYSRAMFNMMRVGAISIKELGIIAMSNGIDW